MATAEGFAVPPGYRVEIVEENIIVSPARRGWEALNAETLARELRGALANGLVAAEGIRLALPETGQRYVPDVVVVPGFLFEGEDGAFPANSTVLVAEVSSPGMRETNRVKKLAGYVTAAVPHYLLVDRTERTVSLFSGPDGRVYRRHLQVPFGEPVDLPAPFKGAINTARFV